MKIIFATNNAHKVAEVQSLTGNDFQIIPLKEAGINIEIPEPYNTLEENALTKARTMHSLTGENCFSEDTGLEVDAINGLPGVKSARYAGDHASASDNIHKLLDSLKDSNNREARFRTVIALIWNDQEYLFEGICNGCIETVQSGNEGFGYDPVFTPEGSNKTFADMPLVEKNKYSHRKKAMDKLMQFLHGQPVQQVSI